MTSHPYKNLPSHTRWYRAVSTIEPSAFDPVVDFPFVIARHDKVATAGSCFAQHIARHMRLRGFSYFVVEQGHFLASDAILEEFQYSTYSARYGNVYTSRQLKQLFERAYGSTAYDVESWPLGDGRYADPFRPTIQPGGFSSLAELEIDRAQHLAQVRRMFEELDYFVFTLGLTECWFDRATGAALPICPGVSGGEYSDDTTGFVNLSVAEVVADMKEFLQNLARVNPRARVILTVSPVPLAATAINRHVVTSTVYSKSVLRVAAEELTSEFPHVTYFPSFEIITAGPSAGRYFGEDRRSVLEDGVKHVMGLFFKHATDPGAVDAAAPINAEASSMAEGRASINAMKEVVQVLCDEELLARE